MPYNADGSKTKNPTRGQRAAYNKQKSQAKKMRKDASGGKTGGAAIGGGAAAGG